MSTDQKQTLEGWLAQTETAVDGLLKTAAASVSALKRLQKASRVGDLRELKRALSTSDDVISALRIQYQSAKREAETFDDETFLASQDFVKELKGACDRAGVKLYEQDDRLFCYPSVVRIYPADKSIGLGKTKSRAIRPTRVAKELAAAQNQPPNFKADAFLEALFNAFSYVSGSRTTEPVSGRVIPLAEIYEIMTLLPGQSKEYSQIEFTRDIYSLDKSGRDRTKKDWRVSFPASTGTKSAGKMLQIVTEKGEEKKYYGLSFTAPTGVK
ncbi:MAG TPA: hypothetical protein VNM92_14350 [Thermoanaerobaculia bacterium]|nr:hypothetical protein [Thermoanaerobaculia bacterium]